MTRLNKAIKLGNHSYCVIYDNVLKFSSMSTVSNCKYYIFDIQYCMEFDCCVYTKNAQ